MVPGLSPAHVKFLADVLRRHRAATGCRWRKLSPSRQALLVLVHLRCGDSFAQLGFSFGVSPVTAYRYVGETVELLAAHARTLEAAMAGQAARGEVTILDGTIIPTFRVRCVSDHKAWYCYRKKTYGVNLQALTDHQGNLLWISNALPGSVHDLTAARTHGVPDCAREYQVRLWADKAYIGEAPTVVTPVKAEKGKELLPCTKTYNRNHAHRRAVGERGFATLKCWKILDRIRCTVTKTGMIAQAILALHHGTSTPIRL